MVFIYVFIWFYMVLSIFVHRKAGVLAAAMGCFHGCLSVLQWAQPLPATGTITATSTAATGQRLLLVRHGDPWLFESE